MASCLEVDDPAYAFGIDKGPVDGNVDDQAVPQTAETPFRHCQPVGFQYPAAAPIIKGLGQRLTDSLGRIGQFAAGDPQVLQFSFKGIA